MDNGEVGEPKWRVHETQVCLGEGNTGGDWTICLEWPWRNDRTPVEVKMRVAWGSLVLETEDEKFVT